MAIKIVPIIPSRSEFPLAILKNIEANIQAAMQGPAKKVLMTAMQRRVANWTSRPSFRSRYSKPPDTFGQLFVFPTGTHRNKWIWVSRGTKKTPRYPVRSRFLKFRPIYGAKTAPGNVYGRAGRRSGPLIRRTVVVTGIAARQFEEHIIKAKESTLESLILIAVKRAVP